MLPSRASVVVVGGGPAGFMAAITAAEASGEGARGEVLLLESTPEPLHKVRISGGGRCNVTHACWDPRLLVEHYPRGGRALRGPFARFAPGDTVSWFADHGLELVEEADGRLFPRSNRSVSVVDSLRRAAIAAGVELHTAQACQAAEALAGGGFRLTLRSGDQVLAERLVLATGSHPSGHRIARSLGHGLVPPVPSLFTLTLADHPLAALAGVSMDPVQLELVLAAPAGPGHRGPRGAPAAARGGADHPLGAERSGHPAAHGLRGPCPARAAATGASCAWTGAAAAPGGGGAATGSPARAGSRRAASSATGRPWPDLSRRLWLHLLALHGVEPALRWADLSRRGEQRRWSPRCGTAATGSAAAVPSGRNS